MFFGRSVCLRVLILFLFYLCLHTHAEEAECNYNGDVKDGKCVCNLGFSGEFCESCTGRFILTNKSGTIRNGPRQDDSLVSHKSNCLGIVNPPLGQNESLLVEFTEAPGSCRNDNLEVHDGTIMDSPILATFNGATKVGMNTKGKQISQSGSFLFDFYSLDRYLMETGYTIRYWVEKDCNSTCQGVFDKTGKPSEVVNENGMKLYMWDEMIVQTRSSFAAAADDRYTYVFGGVEYGQAAAYSPFLKYNRDTMIWEKIPSSNDPPTRSFHSLVMLKDSAELIMYGGKLADGTITNELWRFSSHAWHKVKFVDEQVPPLMGHTAHLVKKDKHSKMFVFFGYNPKWELSEFVYLFNITELSWTRVDPVGYRPPRRFGHSSVLDKDTGLVYVHGGYQQDDLLVFDTETYEWTVLPTSPAAVYLHSLSLAGDSLYVIGGRVCDDEACMCQESKPMKYDIDLKTWNIINNNQVKDASQRYGHGSLTGDEKLNQIILFGGYSSIMRGDVIEYTPQAKILCSGLNATACLDAGNCYWMVSNSTCQQNNAPNCEEICGSLESCEHCQASFCSCCYDSDWFMCSLSTSSSTCNTAAGNCSQSNEAFCMSHNNCYLCFEAGCTWEEHSCRPYVNSTAPETSCEATCSDQLNCGNCTTSGDCVWCETSQVCVPESLTSVHDPYFKCESGFSDECHTVNEIFLASGRSIQSKTINECDKYQSCDECFADKSCGWCNIQESTGVGTCLPGSVNGSAYCSNSSWMYISCPDCQCNGHSNCSTSESSTCGNCTQGYAGSKCESCATLYYGDALNGDECTPCECNGHAENCTKYGTCQCDVFGMLGAHCDQCNSVNEFYGNPVNDSFGCLYRMKLDPINQEYRYDGTSNGMTMSYPKMGFDICLRNLDDITFTARVSNSKPAILTVQINSTSDRDNVTQSIFRVNSTLSFKLTSEYLTKEYGSPCVRLMFDNLIGASFVSITVTQNNYLILKVVLSLSIGAIFLLLIGLGAYKLRQYSEVQQILEMEFEQEERRANRPMAFVNVNMDDGKNIDMQHDTTAMISHEVLHSKKRSFSTVFLILPKQKIEGRHLAIGTAFVKFDANSIPEITEEEEQPEVKVTASSRVLRPITGIFSRLNNTRPAESSQSRSNYSFDNPVLELDNEGIPVPESPNEVL